MLSEVREKAKAKAKAEHGLKACSVGITIVPGFKPELRSESIRGPELKERSGSRPEYNQPRV